MDNNVGMIKRQKKLLFVTGTRADYGKLEPLALSARNYGYDVTFFVTGMHMMSKYGLTKNEVQRSDIKTAEYINQRHGDPQDTVLAKTIVGFSDYLKESMPDMVIIHGDRIESLACALVCSTNYVLCAHIEGGEVSGTIDEVLRHCNTKLANFHLVSSDDAARRVRRLGEMPETVRVIGSPELDSHDEPSKASLAEVLLRYEIDSDNYGICILHPVTSEKANTGSQARELFSALCQSDKYFVVILPNNDPGSDEITSVIEGLPASRFRVLPSMRFSFFSVLMKNAKLIIGNSSAGVREAPFLGLPSIDIGTRQRNRSDAESILHMDTSDQNKIVEKIRNIWGVRFKRNKDFGEGNACREFLSFLNSEETWISGHQKYFNE